MFLTRKTKAEKILSNAKRVIVLAGAGMSAELGTPVYWTGDDSSYGGAVTASGYTPLQHAHATLYRSDLMAQVRYQRAQQVALLSTDVNESHYVNFLKFCSDRDYFIMTTNVDAAFRRAGFRKDKVLEVHGSYEKSQCTRGNHGIWLASSAQLCPQCNAPARPNILFFEDMLYMPSPDNLLAQYAYQDFIDNSSPDDTVVLEIGAGNTVPRLINEMEVLAFAGLPVVKVNPLAYPDDSSYAASVHMAAGEFCRKLA